jgi:hypothetical protein
MSDCKENVNKSNHPIQNPLLLVTEPGTRENTLQSVLLHDPYNYSV